MQAPIEERSSAASLGISASRPLWGREPESHMLIVDFLTPSFADAQAEDPRNRLKTVAIASFVLCLGSCEPLFATNPSILHPWKYCKQKMQTR